MGVTMSKQLLGGLTNKEAIAALAAAMASA